MELPVFQAKFAYSLVELERVTPYCRQHWYDKINSGELVSIKDGRRRLVTHDALVDYFSRKQASTVLPKESPDNSGKRK